MPDDKKNTEKANSTSKGKQFKPKFEQKPKPFEAFSNPKNLKVGPPKSFNAFHRRLGK